jgi:hypothetical protein
MAVINFSIATEAEKSPDFRRVLWTGEHSPAGDHDHPAGR